VVVISSKDILRHINARKILIGFPLRIWVTIYQQRIRNREINKVFLFSNFIKYTFITFTCNFQQNNRQLVTIQPLEEAKNVVEADEIQAQVQAEVNSILLVLSPGL
jgi:hypothetical protein